MTKDLADNIDVWTRVIVRFGVPSAIAGVLLWLGQMAASALHQDVLVPGINGHLRFLEKMSSASERQADSIEALVGAKEQDSKILREMVDSQKAIHAELKAIVEGK